MPPEPSPVRNRMSASGTNSVWPTDRKVEAGKRADLIIVDQNIFEVPITKLHETRVLHAFIDGEEVYSAR
jgi:hypothetical protein